MPKSHFSKWQKTHFQTAKNVFPKGKKDVSKRLFYPMQSKKCVSPLFFQPFFCPVDEYFDHFGYAFGHFVADEAFAGEGGEVM